MASLPLLIPSKVMPQGVIGSEVVVEVKLRFKLIADIQFSIYDLYCNR
jgi:hypothetical protein